MIDSLIRPYQLHASEWLTPRFRAILGDEPGVGKTRSALYGAKLSGARGIQVVCPASVRAHWRHEAEVIGLTVPLDVATYGDLVTGGRSAAEIMRSRWDGGDPTHLIVDEFQYCKHRHSQRSQLLFGDGGLASYFLRPGHIWLVSGTPMPRHPGELYAPLSALWPKYLAAHGVGTWPEWLNTFCVWHANDFGIRVSAAKNVPLLRELLAPLMLRRTALELDLPMTRPRWGLIALPNVGEESAPSSVNLDPSVVASILAGNIPPLDSNLSRYRHILGELKAAPVAQLVSSELDADPSAKRVVFAYHRSVIDELARLLQGYYPRVVTGDTPHGVREMFVRQFQGASYPMLNQPRVFIGQISACGVGMDGLQHGAHEAIIVEPDWSSDVNVQAGHRIARVGQTQPPQVRMAALAGTLDLSLIRNHLRECAMRSQVLEGGA